MLRGIGDAPGGVRLSFVYNYTLGRTIILLDGLMVEKVAGEFWEIVKDYRQDKDSISINIAKSDIYQEWYEVQLGVEFED